MHEDVEEFKDRLCSYASQCRLFADHVSAHVLLKLFLPGLLDQKIRSRVKVCSRQPQSLKEAWSDAEYIYFTRLYRWEEAPSFGMDNQHFRRRLGASSSVSARRPRFNPCYPVHHQPLSDSSTRYAETSVINRKIREVQAEISRLRALLTYQEHQDCIAAEAEADECQYTRFQVHRDK